MGLEAPQNSDPNLHFWPRAVQGKRDKQKEGKKGVVATACARHFRFTDDADNVQHSKCLVAWPPVPLPKVTGVKVARRPDPKILELRHIPSPVQHAWEDLCRVDSLSSDQSSGTGLQEGKHSLFQNEVGPALGLSEVLQKNRKSESGSDTDGTLRHIVAHQLDWRQRLEQPGIAEAPPLLKLLPAMQDNPVFSDSSSPSTPSKAGGHSRSLPSCIPGSITNNLFRIQGLSVNSAQQGGDAAVSGQGPSLAGPCGAVRTRSRVSRIIARWEKGGKPQSPPGSESESERSPRPPPAAKQPRRLLLSRFLGRTSSSVSESPAACLPHGRTAPLSFDQQPIDGQNANRAAHSWQAYRPASQRSSGGSPRPVACQQADESVLAGRVEAVAAQVEGETAALWEAKVAALQLTPHKDRGGGIASSGSPGGNQQHVMELLPSILDTLRKQQSSIQGQQAFLCDLRDICSRAAEAQEVGAALEACLKRHGLLPESDQGQPQKALQKVIRGEVGCSELEGGPAHAQQDEYRMHRVQREEPTSQQHDGPQDAGLMGDDTGDGLDAWQMDAPLAETPAGVKGEGIQAGRLPFSQNGVLFDELFTSTSAASSVFSLSVTPQTAPSPRREAAAATPSPEHSGGGAAGSPKPRKSWIGKILRRKRTGHKADSS